MKLRCFRRLSSHVLLGSLFFGLMSESAFSMQAGWGGVQSSVDVVWWLRGFWPVAIGFVGIAILPPFYQRLLTFLALDLICCVPKACCIGHILLKHLPVFIILRLKIARCGLHLRYLLLKRFIIHKGRDLGIFSLPNSFIESLCF